MKRSFLQLVILAFLSIYNAICVVTGGAHLKKLVPTGVITQGILGGFSGKVGPVVGGSWKGIDYMRGYVIPANPNTPAQQTQRNKFGAMVGYAKQILSDLIQTYWDPFAVQMSGFNRFIQENIGSLSASNIITENNTMSVGTLEPIAGITSALTNGTTIDLIWDGTVTGNGLATDSIMCVFFSVASDTLELITMTGPRMAGSETVTPVNAPSDSDYVWLFCFRGTGQDFVVSNSLNEVVAV